MCNFWQGRKYVFSWSVFSMRIGDQLAIGQQFVFLFLFFSSFIWWGTQVWWVHPEIWLCLYLTASRVRIMFIFIAPPQYHRSVCRTRIIYHCSIFWKSSENLSELWKSYAFSAVRLSVPRFEFFYTEQAKLCSKVKVETKCRSRFQGKGLEITFPTTVEKCFFSQKIS